MSSRRISQSCARALLPGFMATSEKAGLLGNLDGVRRPAVSSTYHGKGGETWKA
jgi:hypothetical protein